MGNGIFLDKQRNSERENDNGHNFNDSLESGNNLTGFFFDVFCTGGNARNVVAVRHTVGTRAAGARNDEAAGQKKVAWLFEHCIPTRR